MPSAEPVRTAIVVTHGRPETIGEALGRLEEVARDSGVELVYPADEAEKHDRSADGDSVQADMVVVLGGDGTMLRALQRALGSGTPMMYRVANDPRGITNETSATAIPVPNRFVI